MWSTQRSVLSHQASTKTQSTAVKRLLKDVRQLAESKPPIVGIAAQPLEKDLFEWHANLKGPKGTPYEGGIFHLVLKFPHTYPYNPPTVTVSTKLPHPNVFGNSICLDMLQAGSEELYAGWSTAYSVQSILIQLQAFLFELPATGSEWTQEHRQAKEAANNFSCSICPHKPFRVWPEFPNLEQETFVVMKSELDIAKEELTCFHSKRNFTDDTLGFGISFNRSIKTGEIQNITSGLDLIGIKAFMREGVRKSLANEPFTHWIPVYINPEHGIRAVPLAKRALSMICKGNTKAFEPRMALEVIPKLMNTMIVQIMKGKIHASIKMLEGYCAFHMWFLLFLREHPELLQQVQQTVNSFLSSEAGRHKDQLPNLGEFLTLLSVVPADWKKVCPLLIEEAFDRQVGALVKQFPQFGKKEPDAAVDKERANVTFEATLVSHRLIMFHKYFLEVVHSLGKTLQEKITTYESLYGKPTPRMIDNMLVAFKDITKVSNYSEYFSHIGYPQQTPEQITAWLRRSVENSDRKGYHNIQGPKVPTHEELAAERAAKLVPLKSLCDASGQLKADEAVWRKLSEDIHDFKTLPEGEETIDNPWRHLYLMNNLQDLISRLNDHPDFSEFYDTLDLSAPIITKLDLTLFAPTKLKSGFYYLTGTVGRLTQLKNLVITKSDTELGTKGSKALLKGIQGSKQLPLAVLDLSHVGPTEELIAGLGGLPLLHTLNLSSNNLSETSVKALSQILWEHKSLTELDLSNCHIDKHGAKTLADALLANKRLKVVALGKNPLMTRGLTAILYNLAFSPSIDILNLPKIELGGGRGQSNSAQDTSDLSEALTKLFQITQTLSTLNLWQTKIATSLNQQALMALGTNRSLTNLDLGEIGELNTIHMGHLGAALANNKTLSVLNLENNNISGEALQSLYTSLFKEKEEATPDKDTPKQSQTKKKDNTPNREDLRNAIMDKTQEKEKEFHFNLKSLNLQKNSLGATGGKVIGKLVIISQYLTELQLESAGLGVEAGETLGLALETNTVLTTLHLRNNMLGKEGAKHLSVGLKNNKALTFLDISGNHLGVPGAQAFAEMLKTNNKLTSLNLFGNLCDVDGAIALASALAVNSTLTQLDLGLNRIRNKGAQALAQTLKTNNVITKLGLKLNFVKNKGALDLIHSISNNKESKLRSISLAGNDIDDSVLIQISDTLKVSKPNIKFDLQARVLLMDPDRIERRVWVSPLPIRTTTDMIKKLFLDNNCGVVSDVDLHEHKHADGATKYRYAFVEFAHKNSVELALNLPPNKARVLSKRVGIYRAGSQTKSDKDKEEEQGGPRGSRGAKRPSRGGRGGGRGGSRGGASGGRGRGGFRQQRAPRGSPAKKSSSSRGTWE